MDMKVTLIDYTGKNAIHIYPDGSVKPDVDYAIDLLIFTKSTRLNMSPGLLDDIKEWPLAKKMTELEYIANTIPSSWEFVHYTFMVEGVSRAFTHQFVRSRQFSFAQQTHRILDTSTGPGWDYHTGPTIIADGAGHLKIEYDDVMKRISEGYSWLVDNDAAIEDARGILPTNILTNIVASCNMRTFVELVRKRSSPRTQSEYRDVLEAMKEAVREVHPWIDLFIERTFDKAANELCLEIKKMADAANAAGDAQMTSEQATRLIKLVDQMRGQS
jgi:thymidylate synthase (FAD)